MKILSNHVQSPFTFIAFLQTVLVNGDRGLKVIQITNAQADINDLNVTDLDTNHLLGNVHHGVSQPTLKALGEVSDGLR